MTLRRTRQPTCSFCGEPRSTVEPQGGGPRICVTCVGHAIDIIREYRARPAGTVTCSFCAGQETASEWLVSGPRVFICDACVTEAGTLFTSTI